MGSILAGIRERFIIIRVLGVPSVRGPDRLAQTGHANIAHALCVRRLADHHDPDVMLVERGVPSQAVVAQARFGRDFLDALPDGSPADNGIIIPLGAKRPQERLPDGNDG